MTSRKPTNSKSPHGSFVVSPGATPDAARDPLQRLIHDAKLGQAVPSKAQLQRMQLRFVASANNLGAHGTSTHALPQGSPWTTPGRLTPWFGACLAAVGVSLLLLSRPPAPSTPATPLETAPALVGDRALTWWTAAATTAQEANTHATPEVSASTQSATAKGTSKAERPKASAPSQPDPLLQGLRELEAAELALRAEQLDEARRHLAKDVPRALTVHRSALRAMLACKTGDVALGHKLLAEHAKAFPKSPYLARMRAACQ